MVSSIAPVYRNDFLEGVVGLDATVKIIIDEVLNLQLPWNAYAVLIDRQGTLLALPPEGEKDWGLRELTDHSYEHAIMQDTFKPDDFNIHLREDTRIFSESLKTSPTDLVEQDMAGDKKLISYSEVAGTGWDFAIIVSEKEIYREANNIQQRFERVGLIMLCTLIVFYILFFLFLYRKSFQLSKKISNPLIELAGVIESIGSGNYQQEPMDFDVSEMQQTSHGLVTMASRLEESRDNLEAARKSLETLNAELELRVENRTAELKHANIQLGEEKAEQQRLIDELHTTQTQLVQSEKMASLGMLAAGVAHEINNPLGYIISNIESLKEYFDSITKLISKFEEAAVSTELAGKFTEYKEAFKYGYINEDLPELISDITEGTMRVRKIVEGLRDFSHPGDTSWQVTDINDCIASTLSLSNNEIKFKAEVEKDLAELPKIRCIPSQINQVLLNIFVNAAQAMEHMGLIRVGSREENGGVTVEISDNGSGISKETMMHIFDPFFTTKEIGKGTGLGLSLSYGIIQSHRGKIDVDSEVGKGTTFKIWLPVDPEKVQQEHRQ